MTVHKKPEASLAYKKIPAGRFSPETRMRVKANLEKMGACDESRVFHIKRDVKYCKQVRDTFGLETRDVDIFVAINPCVEMELQHVTKLMTREGCEFPIYAHTNSMTFETDGNHRTYYMVFERGDIPTPSPVLFKADAYATFNEDRWDFIDKVQDIRLYKGEKKLEYFAHVLEMIEQKFVNGSGVPAQLSWGGRVRWKSGTECSTENAKFLIHKLASEGLAGPTFVYTPNMTYRHVGFFDFHGHPAYNESFVAPPSSMDIEGASSEVFDRSEHLRVCVQAIALQAPTGSFRLFLNAYIMGEDWDYANYEPILIQASYLNSVFNSLDKRKVDNTAVRLLRDARRMEPVFAGNEKLEMEIDHLDFDVSLGRGSPHAHKKQWNGVVSTMNEIHRHARGSDFIVPESVWTQRLWNLSGGEIDLGDLSD